VAVPPPPPLPVDDVDVLDELVVLDEGGGCDDLGDDGGFGGPEVGGGSGPPSCGADPVDVGVEAAEDTTAVRWPSGPMVTDVVADDEVRLVAPPGVAGSVPGYSSAGITCEPGLRLPAGMSVLETCGAKNWAIPPNAVARTTPLAASMR
jgi:hypothetical protein